jgi:DNA-binding NtrC family response regulator
MAERRILLVDDDQDVRLPLKRYLQGHGFEVREAEGVATALESFKMARPDLALVDFSLGDGDGMDLLRSLKALDPALPVIMLTGHGTIDLAVQAIKEGAEQFFTKPVELPALEVVILRALDNQRVRQVSMVGRSTQARQVIDPFLGESEAIRKLADRARRVAASAVPLLIQGETGTGKGVLAKWFHHNGPRRDEAFVDLNCAGLSRDLLESELFGHEKGAFTGAVAAKQGLFDMAHRGTVFLDEIGEVDAQVQPKLLKVVEELRFRRLGDVRDRQVDVRLVAATHRDLGQLVEQGKFREDLLYRLNAVPLAVPPLRERGRDVVLLARNLAARVGAEVGRPALRLSGSAERALETYSWPGNVRQLRNVLERAALLGERDQLEAEDLGEGMALRSASTAPSSKTGAAPMAASGSTLSLVDAERLHIEGVVRAHGGDVPAAAKVLGISRSTLYEKIRRHGLTLPPPRA